MEYRKFGDTYVLRLDQGEEVMESLHRFAEAEQISLASVQGIGALSAFDLKAHHYEGCYEITSLLGTIDTMDGQFYCHLHLNAAEQDDHPVGGHLTRAVIRVTGELIVRVLDGQVERAMDYLGHPHILTQTVRHGRRIGRTIGIPTVNLVPPPHVLVPGDGVYVARVCLEDGSSYAAVTNVGTRPTVNNGSDLTVESWMLDFEGDLYGQSIRVEFYRRLRDEIRFDSLEALKHQIETDAESVRAYFKEKQ